MNAQARAYARPAIRPEMTVRQIAADFPASRAVFCRYGEPADRGARFGHLEPLTHFVRRQGISLDALLAELSAATGIPAERRGHYAENAHHAFLLSALLITLSLGSGWGAWLLWSIGAHGNFDTAPAASIIAHGEAQLWGFVVLFIMGVSLRTALQGVVRSPPGPWIGRSLLGLGWLGIAGGFAWYLSPARLAALGAASAVSLLAMAILYWLLQIVMVRSKWRATWARAVLASGFWLVVWALVTLYLRWRAGGAGPAAYTDAQRLLLVELAVFGFAMNSIYGFGQMLLPGLLRLGSTRDWAIELSHWAHNMGTLVACLGTAWEWPAAIIASGCALLAGGAVLFAIGNRGFIGRRRTSRRAEQGHSLLDLYPPLAFFWLVASLLLMTGGLIYEMAGTPLPRAYMGAVRHAITVGFMTTLILGVGQRILPVLDRKVLVMPQLILPIFILIALGNLLRVTTELATMATPAAFTVMPFSAVFEWLAIVLFTTSCLAMMYGVDPLLRRGRVCRRSSLAVLLAEHPWLEDRLIARGIAYLERTRSVPSELTIGSAAESEGQNADELVDQINGWLVTKGDCPSRGAGVIQSPSDSALPCDAKKG
ncbi:MAG: NnrS family protein [Pirellulales bacterium]|nr:NnrS family protein [Pirellulales bacterium]